MTTTIEKVVQCWSTVYDAGPTFYQHLVDLSCLLEYTECTAGVQKMFLSALVTKRKLRGQVRVMETGDNTIR